MELGLKGKVAVVTGGTEGIGRATALRLAQEGAQVAICARRREMLDKMAAEIKKLGCEIISDPGVVPVKFRAPGGTVAEIVPTARYKKPD